ncbi:MAG TPA: hypothetical protein VG013_22480 [Gemmataceae bacterium]|jgi:hypothetical protein|nr:hypothetical protein [Gemmataceae bacterium]
MSTAPTPQASPNPVIAPGDREIRIYSHSALFYWWPVWAVGFLMTLLTFIDNHRLAVLPAGTEAARKAEVIFHRKPAEKVDLQDRDVLILPQGQSLLSDAKNGEDSPPAAPKLHMARSKNFGVLYATVLLVIIVISNVPLRGLWSVIVILFVVLFIVIMALADVWTWLVDKISLLDIRINAGGYLFISLVLFIIWALTVFIFDHRTYVAISSGQVRVCLAVGAGETVYDTTGMTFQKRQDDLFRHWIVGLGSGDLILHRTQSNQEIDLPNVLFIGAKIKEIEKLVKEREVV